MALFSGLEARPRSESCKQWPQLTGHQRHVPGQSKVGENMGDSPRFCYCALIIFLLVWRVDLHQLSMGFSDGFSCRFGYIRLTGDNGFPDFYDVATRRMIPAKLGGEEVMSYDVTLCCALLLLLLLLLLVPTFMLYTHHEIVRSHGQGPISSSYALRTSHQWTSVLGRIAHCAHTSSRSRTRDSRLKHQRMYLVSHVSCLEIGQFLGHLVGPIHRRLDNRKNTYDSFPLVVLGFMFDIGEEESHFLKQFYLGPVLSEWVIEKTGNGCGHRITYQKQTAPR